MLAVDSSESLVWSHIGDSNAALFLVFIPFALGVGIASGLAPMRDICVFKTLPEPLQNSRLLVDVSRNSRTSQVPRVCHRVLCDTKEKPSEQTPAQP